jgi:hypothetical protein
VGVGYERFYRHYSTSISNDQSLTPKRPEPQISCQYTLPFEVDLIYRDVNPDRTAATAPDFSLFDQDFQDGIRLGEQVTVGSRKACIAKQQPADFLMGHPFGMLSEQSSYGSFQQT